ncbi:MAG: hypothetical protein E6R06_25300 [Mycobacterium sp.]|nr:MAG: hypothetical protein E6R06_25300 [Mycobacterium sp.]
MPNLLQSCATAGAALMTAGVIAAPVAPLAERAQVPEIQLTALSGAGAAVQVATFIGDPLDFTIVQPAASYTLDLTHGFLWATLNGLPPFGDGTPVIDDPFMLAMLNFAASPLSGVLIGALGPSLSPLVEAFNNLDAVFTDLGNGDFDQALNGLLAMPGNAFDAFMNGTTLNLDWAIPMLESTGMFPDGSLVSFDIALGGILTEGVTIGDSADFTENLGTGGSIFNALGFGLPGDGSADVIGQATGLSGAWDNLVDLVTAALNTDA